jgi:hypothetical protein
MAHGCFTVRTDQPDSERAEAVLGAARPLWDELLGDLEARSTARGAWRFYGRNHGWALAFRRHGRAVAAKSQLGDARRLIDLRAGHPTNAGSTEERDARDRR